MSLPATRAILLLPFRRPRLFLAALVYSGLLYGASFLAGIDEIMDPYWVLTMAVLLLLSPFFNGVSILSLHARNDKGATLWRALTRTITCYPRLVVGELVVNGLVILGSLAFLVPGVYLGLRLIFYKQAILIDDASLIASLQASAARTTGWRIPVMLLLLLTPFFAVPAAMSYATLAFSLGASGEVLTVVVSAAGLVWVNALVTSVYAPERESPAGGEENV